MANILILSVEKRKETALKVQKVLTESGCFIKTRLGLHESGEGKCSDTGLIILQLEASSAEIKALISNLKKIKGVKVNSVKI
ncbi:MAG: hypothetical protein FWG57_01595 [Endomicrobia bacterium]|nr:hypothetical protein [Endomicrobiia bacterium]